MKNHHSSFFQADEHHLVSGVQFGGTSARHAFFTFPFGYLRFRGLKKWHSSMSSNCVNFFRKFGVLTGQMSQPTSSVNAEVSRVFGRSQVNPSSSPNQTAIASSSHFRRLMNMRRIGTANIRNRTNRSRSKAKENTPFLLCDLTLLPGAGVSVVPRQGSGIN